MGRVFRRVREEERREKIDGGQRRSETIIVPPRGSGASGATRSSRLTRVELRFCPHLIVLLKDLLRDLVLGELLTDEISLRCTQSDAGNTELSRECGRKFVCVKRDGQLKQSIAEVPTPMKRIGKGLIDLEAIAERSRNPKKCVVQTFGAQTRHYYVPSSTNPRESERGSVSGRHDGTMRTTHHFIRCVCERGGEKKKDAARVTRAIGV